METSVLLRVLKKQRTTGSKSGGRINRRLLRQKALQLLYAIEINQESYDVIEQELLADVKHEDEREFFRSLVRQVLRHIEPIDKEIERKVTNWELDRIALIDRLLLRMGLCEIIYFPDIPPKVSINEYIEIAKDYSTASSGKFINGILDNILSEFKESGKIKKMGRGLVDRKMRKGS